MSDRASVLFELPGAHDTHARCAACATRVCEALRTLPGVARVDCQIDTASVRVEYDPGRISEAELTAESDRFGFELAESVRHAAWRVTGLD